MSAPSSQNPAPPPYIAPEISQAPETAASYPAEKVKSPAPRRQYATFTPVERLRFFAAPTECPVCKQRELTQLNYKIGGITHIMAFTGFCTTVVLFWVPYLLKGMKNVEHRCGNPECNILLATWHRAPTPGILEVHQFR